MLHHAIAAVPDNERNADGADEIHQRKKHRVIIDCVDVCFAVVVVDAGKAAQRFLFRIENLHRLRAREVLLQKGIDARDARAHHVIALARAFAKPGGRGEKHGHGQQRHQRQARVHPDHHRDDCHNHHQVAQ